LVSAVYVPVAIIMILYALFTYEWRSRFMHKKQVGGRGGVPVMRKTQHVQCRGGVVTNLCVHAILGAYDGRHGNTLYVC
jgi:hypothetical protein